MVVSTEVSSDIQRAYADWVGCVGVSCRRRRSRIKSDVFAGKRTVARHQCTIRQNAPSFLAPLNPALRQSIGGRDTLARSLIRRQKDPRASDFRLQYHHDSGRQVPAAHHTPALAMQHKTLE